MAILDIRKYPDRILRKKAYPVDKIDKKIKMLIYDMIETMRNAGGVGLAGPQIGINKRIIVVEDVENHTKALAVINPKIIKRKGRANFCEGCLSIPGITSDVVRPELVVVEAFNIQGEVVQIDTGGLLARILQHEIDHLDGVLFIDRIGFLKRKKIMKDISKKVCMEL